jgi:hypothetical protein
LDYAVIGFAANTKCAVGVHKYKGLAIVARIYAHCFCAALFYPFQFGVYKSSEMVKVTTAAIKC